MQEKKSVTDKEIARTIAKKLNLKNDLVKEAIRLYFDEIKKSVLKDMKVHLSGFGTFEERKWKASQIYNINTKEKIFLGMKTVRFKASPAFKEKVLK